MAQALVFNQRAKHAQCKNVWCHQKKQFLDKIENIYSVTIVCR